MDGERFRVCKKCLMRDMLDKGEELRKLEVLIDRLPAPERATEDVYEQRLAICRECDLLMDGTCNACGCYVELRAATKASRCPKKKW